MRPTTKKDLLGRRVVGISTITCIDDTGERVESLDALRLSGGMTLILSVVELGDDCAIRASVVTRGEEKP